MGSSFLFNCIRSWLYYGSNYGNDYSSSSHTYHYSSSYYSSPYHYYLFLRPLIKHPVFRSQLSPQKCLHKFFEPDPHILQMYGSQRQHDTEMASRGIHIQSCCKCKALPGASSCLRRVNLRSCLWLFGSMLDSTLILCIFVPGSFVYIERPSGSMVHDDWRFGQLYSIVAKPALGSCAK